MTTFIAVRCLHCHRDHVVKRGKIASETQRYLCQNTECVTERFLLDYRNRGCLPEVKLRWSFVRRKTNPRWLSHAIDHSTGAVLAYVFDRRKDQVSLKPKELLEPFGLTHYYTDKWGAYTRHLDPEQHTTSKRYTQKIERRHLTLRARIKRLTLKTICFSTSTQMHDIVIGLFVNRYAFGRPV